MHIFSKSITQTAKNSPSSPPSSLGEDLSFFGGFDESKRSHGPQWIDRTQRIFCNRTLKLNHISWIGFDMDYTLAIYDQYKLDKISIEATVEKLIQRGYPAYIHEFSVSLDYAVRGLIIDKKYGHVLKMDRYRFVSKGYHGFRPLSKVELRKLYYAQKVEVGSSRYHWTDTLYSLAEVALYAALVDGFEKRGFKFHFAKLFDDIRSCIDEAHRDGTILDVVSADLSAYVDRNDSLAEMLVTWRDAGKKLFLLTNSRWEYTEKMMSYLLPPLKPAYPSWKDYFDIVIAAAQKPDFFEKNTPFMEIKRGSAVLANGPLKRGRIYENGNLNALERQLKVDGDTVLYIGDHIYGDILRSKKQSAWRTAMIIQELETEILADELCRLDYVRAEQLLGIRENMSQKLMFYSEKLQEIERETKGKSFRNDEAFRVPFKKGVDKHHSARAVTNGTEHTVALQSEYDRLACAVDRLYRQLNAIDQKIDLLDQRISLRFHPFWGSIMKESKAQSLFGAQVQNYACVYTSRVTNFLAYSGEPTFLSPRDRMAHELHGP